MVAFSREKENSQGSASESSSCNATSVRLSEILAAELRLEASAYDPIARAAVEEIRHFPGGFDTLYGQSGSPVTYATNAFRFRRNFVSKSKGVPFISSSDIISIDARTNKYLSRSNTKKLPQLLIQKGDVLISCSGTVGNIGFAGQSLADAACSQHVIRARSENLSTAGFVAAFLRTRHGRLQLTRSVYGSVVQHIEPEHLRSVIIARLHAIEQAELGRKFVEAAEARDEALRLLNFAHHALLSAIGLEDWTDLRDAPPVNEVRLSELSGRFEASYHSALAAALDQTLRSSNFAVEPVEGFGGSTRVEAVTKFRKRVYVDAPGIPLLTSKQILQVDPIDKKVLGRGRHAKDLPEIGLHRGMLLVTCSGTIGRTLMVPDYMEGWAASQDALRVISNDERDAAYMYAWLSSTPGQILIRRMTYGSVVVHIDKEMLGSLPVPLVSQSARDEISGMILRANELRSRAWTLEQEAIAELEGKIQSNTEGANAPKTLPSS